MKKLLIILSVFLISCAKPPRVLDKKEYKIIDTLEVNYNNFGDRSGAKVIIKYDSTYHYGVTDSWGNLMKMNPRNLKNIKLK